MTYNLYSIVYGATRPLCAHVIVSNLLCCELHIFKGRVTSQGPEAGQKQEENGPGQHFANLYSTRASQGYCTGQLSRSNCQCDLHVTWL